MFHSLTRAYARLNTAVGMLSGFALLVAGIILFYEVVCRTIGRPTSWVAETSVYLFAGAVLLGASYTLMRERHVRVELLICRFSLPVQDVCYLVSSLGGLAFCLVVAHYGWMDLVDNIETGETTATTLRIPLWIIETPLFIGFVLTALQFLVSAIQRAIRLANGSPAEGLPTGGGH